MVKDKPLKSVGRWDPGPANDGAEMGSPGQFRQPPGPGPWVGDIRLTPRKQLFEASFTVNFKEKLFIVRKDQGETGSKIKSVSSGTGCWVASHFHSCQLHDLQQVPRTSGASVSLFVKWA